MILIAINNDEHTMIVIDGNDITHHFGPETESFYTGIKALDGILSGEEHLVVETTENYKVIDLASQNVDGFNLRRVLDDLSDTASNRQPQKVEKGS